MTFRLLLTSYATNSASDNLHPSICGGNWIVAGEYQNEHDANNMAQQLSSVQHGSLPGNVGFAFFAVVVKT